MAYSNFSLDQAITNFQLQENYHSLFEDMIPIPPSDWLIEALDLGRRLALPGGSEKARSEFLIAPIFLELERHYRDRLAVYSGCNLRADPHQNLDGECDFLLARGPGGLMVRAPILSVVEAKRDNVEGGIGQCVAQMVGVQIFNQLAAQPETKAADHIGSDNLGLVFGCVTTGEIWQFLRLDGTSLTIDRDHFYIERLERLLAAFRACLEETLS